VTHEQAEYISRMIGPINEDSSGDDDNDYEPVLAIGKL
jgi:hypothetical protein